MGGVTRPGVPPGVTPPGPGLTPGTVPGVVPGTVPGVAPGVVPGLAPPPPGLTLGGCRPPGKLLPPPGATAPPPGVPGMPGVPGTPPPGVKGEGTSPPVPTPAVALAVALVALTAPSVLALTPGGVRKVPAARSASKGATGLSNICGSSGTTLRPESFCASPVYCCRNSSGVRSEKRFGPNCSTNKAEHSNGSSGRTDIS